MFEKRGKDYNKKGCDIVTRKWGSLSQSSIWISKNDNILHKIHQLRPREYADIYRVSVCSDQRGCRKKRQFTYEIMLSSDWHSICTDWCGGNIVLSGYLWRCVLNRRYQNAVLCHFCSCNVSTIFQWISKNFLSLQRDYWSGESETRTTYLADRNQRPNQLS